MTDAFAHYFETHIYDFCFAREGGAVLVDVPGSTRPTHFRVVGVPESISRATVVRCVSNLVFAIQPKELEWTDICCRARGTIWPFRELSGAGVRSNGR